MEYTQNYKFRLPADSDIIDIGDIDENFINVDALIATLRSDKADKNSPSFTGTPKSTTPTSSDNSTRIATTAFVQALISSLQTAQLQIKLIKIHQHLRERRNRLHQPHQTIPRGLPRPLLFRQSQMIWRKK